MMSFVGCTVFSATFDLWKVSDCPNSTRIEYTTVICLGNLSSLILDDYRVILICIWIIFDYHYSEKMQLCPLLDALSLALILDLQTMSVGINSAIIE